MKRYYLAIDIGASSGRHILGHMEDGKMVLEEIYRGIFVHGTIQRIQNNLIALSKKGNRYGGWMPGWLLHPSPCFRRR